jgi:2-polyprenyl-3-methyl-5-hydroxy-6-metoxy-1,4-benzoquinol methylase
MPEKVVAQLDPEEIEIANAHGPYSHGTWTGRDATFGSENTLAGRGAFLVESIRNEISRRYTLEQIQKMTLVDVGCYDGWLLCQFADLPFRRLLGIEPRRKNLDKGTMIRRLLRIETRCEFREGSIETLESTLGGEKADIVICAGLLHHLSSTADAIARLRGICRGLLFLETICLPASVEDDRLKMALELKDLPYFFNPPVFAATGHKYESGYYDGSTLGVSVVSVPSVEALRMFLSAGGFTDIRVVAAPEAYSSSVKDGWRRFNATCLSSVVNPDHDGEQEVAAWVEKYEGGLICTLLPEKLTRALFQRVCLGQASSDTPWLARILLKSMAASGWRFDFWSWIIRRSMRDRYVLEICRNLRYAPHDKVAIEHGKSLVARGCHQEAYQVLIRVTRQLNADWRSVYRAFCLLAWSFREQNDTVAAQRYEDLCRIANPQFPAALLGGSIAMFRRFKNEERTTKESTR